MISHHIILHCNHLSGSLDSHPTVKSLNPDIPAACGVTVARYLAKRYSHALVDIKRRMVAVGEATDVKAFAEMIGQDPQHEGEGQGPMDEQSSVAVDVSGVERIEVNCVGIKGECREVEKVSCRGREGDGVRGRVRVWGKC